MSDVQSLSSPNYSPNRGPFTPGSSCAWLIQVLQLLCITWSEKYFNYWVYANKHQIFCHLYSGSNKLCDQLLVWLDGFDVHLTNCLPALGRGAVQDESRDSRSTVRITDCNNYEHDACIVLISVQVSNNIDSTITIKFKCKPVFDNVMFVNVIAQILWIHRSPVQSNKPAYIWWKPNSCSLSLTSLCFSNLIWIAVFSRI